jgi:hypothetical protein
MLLKCSGICFQATYILLESGPRHGGRCVVPFVRVLLNETAVFAGETRIEGAVTGYAVNTRGENGFVADRRKQ